MHHSAGAQGFRSLTMEYDGDSMTSDDGSLAAFETRIVSLYFKMASHGSKVHTIDIQQIQRATVKERVSKLV